MLYGNHNLYSSIDEAFKSIKIPRHYQTDFEKLT